MIKKIKLLVFIFLAGVNSMAYAQSDSSILSNHINQLQQYAVNNPVEKAYLHLDRPWYGLGDTIWFKAYTVVGGDHRLSALSGVLYAELISTNDTVLQRLTLQLHSGISTGEFILPYTYKPGSYRLRAYTNWMRNDSDYFYDRKIIVGGLKAIQGMPADKTDGQVTNQQSQADVPDIQFFPEGGYLVNGLRSKVAFKAVNKNGIAADIRGVITDQDGNELAFFNTQHAGMGQFPLTPQRGMHYKAKIICADGNNYLIDLPSAKDEGFTLTVNNTRDSLLITIAANDMLYKNRLDTAFYLLAQSGGKYYFAAGSKLTNHVFSTQIAKTRFPTGLTQFTLFSQSGEPLSERIVFIQNDDQLKLILSTEKESYIPKENVKIDFEAKNKQDKAVTGSFSVSVTDETKVPVDEAEEPTIFTHLLLTSELKGNIENPNYYFMNQDDKARSYLDLLMLTQGYRRFEWKKILADIDPKMTFQPQESLSLSGTIKTLSNKPVANGKIRLTSIKDLFVTDTMSNANGSFTFSNLYLDDSTKVVINAKKAKGGTNVKISIKQPSYAKIDKLEKKNITDVNAGLPEPLLNALNKTYVTGQQQSLKNVIHLKEVKIKSRRNLYFNPVYSDNMKFSSNLNGAGNANQVILGDVLMRGGGGRLSDILPGKIDFVTFKGGLPCMWRRGFGSIPMAIFIEGAQASADMLNDINPDDIYSIEVLRSGGYLAIYGSNAPYGALIITLKHGVDPADTSNQVINGLITYKFNGFYKVREFYSPKYTSETAQILDDRKTIYWNPNIITGANGKSSFEYFNAGSPGTYRVVVEGIDGDGNLGRQVFRYKVE